MKIGDKVDMYKNVKRRWEKVDTGTVIQKTNRNERMLVNHIKVVFLKNPYMNIPFLIPLNLDGSVNKVRSTFGYKFKETPYQYVRDYLKLLTFLNSSRGPQNGSFSQYLQPIPVLSYEILL